jgi:hypothetical protein
MKYFIIEEDQLQKLESVAKRLYSEIRMSGDEMRDSAHRISGVVRLSREIPWEEKMERKAPAVFDVEKIKELMTDEGYGKFLQELEEISKRKENTLVLYQGKPFCVFIPGWKLSDAIDKLAQE